MTNDPPPPGDTRRHETEARKPAENATPIRESTRVVERPGSRYYIGVIRSGGRIIWECEHHHPNRTWGGRYGGESAVTCAVKEMQTRLASGESIHEDSPHARVKQSKPLAEYVFHPADDEFPY